MEGTGATTSGLAKAEGAEWVGVGLSSLTLSQCVFGTDYSQVIQEQPYVSGYVSALQKLGLATTMLDGTDANVLLRGLYSSQKHFERGGMSDLAPLTTAKGSNPAGAQ
jgi:hypothetical protein